jgi:hypothetical protein
LTHPNTDRKRYQDGSEFNVKVGQFYLTIYKWGEFFSEDSSLLCSLDRIFDIATVFTIKGQTYRGKQCNTITLAAGRPSALPKQDI